MQQVKNTLFTALTVLLVFFILARFLGPIPLSVNSVTTTKNDLFRVEGRGEASGTPDTALINLGVTKTAPTVTEGQNQVNLVSKKLLEDLKNLGVEEKNIKTTNYSVNPNYEYGTTGKQSTNGYTVTQNLEVRIKPVDKANKAIDIATADGANQVGGITFVLNDDTRDQLEQKARKEAIEDAREKAQSLANAAGIKLGRIIDIQLADQQPINKFAAQDARGVGGLPTEQTTVTTGENTINVTVTLGYETL